MSIQLHETVMGRRLIEHTLPKIGRALEKIAKGMEKPKEKEWYVVFATLFDPDKPGHTKAGCAVSLTIDQTAMFETLKEAEEYYENRRNLKNCHSAGIARLVEGTDWM
jgi:hypothetical protein